MDIFTMFYGWSDVALFFLRLVLGAIFIVHGKMKLRAWKTPMPMQNVMRFLSVAETLGGIAVIFGFLTQLAAMGFACIMLGAIWMKMKAWKMPFTTMSGTGWEFDLINLAASLVLITSGAGMYSLDRWISSL